MKHFLILLLCFSSPGFAQQAEDPSAVKMTAAANKLLASLNAEQKKICSFKFDDPERLNWHFIPRERKGVAFRGLEGDAFI
ncbi:MAG: DUF3500 domain-containing protein, partial [Planctomycetaceae bacterium]